MKQTILIELFQSLKQIIWLRYGGEGPGPVRQGEGGLPAQAAGEHHRNNRGHGRGCRVKEHN